MKNIIRIVAAVVDTRHLTLYDEKGETVLIPQGDIRVRRVLDEATPQLISHGFADVDITPETDNTYLEFEEQSNGVVKLFRIAKLYAEGHYTELRAMKKAAKVSWEKLGVPDPGNTEDTTVAQAVPTSESEVAKLVQATHGEGSARERIKKLLSIGLTSVGVAQAILDLKKQSKKSWSYLEVSEGEVNQITKLTAVK